MKRRLLLDNQLTPFREPYYIYDIISVYNKGLNTYTPKRRATAVSFSDTSEIVMAFAVCNDLDSFSKKTARQILNGRIVSSISDYNNYLISEPVYTGTCRDCYIFDSLETYIQYCNMFDSMAFKFFMPYRVKYSSNLGQKPENVDISGKASDFYLHRNFVIQAQTSFWKNNIPDSEFSEGTNLLDTTTVNASVSD